MLRLLRTLLCLTLVAGALLPASASAQTPAFPCEAWTPCTPVSGGWMPTPPNSGELASVNCPDNTRAVGADVAFPPNASLVPVLVQVGAASGLGGSGAYFGLPPLPISVTYQPWLGCSPTGPITLQFRGRGDGPPAQYRARVRTRRIRPGRHVGAALGCLRGERLVRSGSAMQFFTREPPSPRVVEALVYRHRRTGSVMRADVTAPTGVGDNERVELQVTTICSR
jgi:hypothetical protein